MAKYISVTKRTFILLHLCSARNTKMFPWHSITEMLHGEGCHTRLINRMISFRVPVCLIVCYNKCVTDRQKTDRQTDDRNIEPKTLS